MRVVVVLTIVMMAVACSEPGSEPPGTAISTELPTTLATTPATVPPTADTSFPPSTAAPTPASSLPATTLAPLQGLDYDDAVPADFFPVVLTARPGDDHALLAERRGVVYRFEGGAKGERIGDISDRTTTNSERGLLGMVRHPSDDTRLFVHYTDLNGDTTVSEFAYDGSVDVSSERVLLSVGQPASNHNGGMIQFGPDGALYLGLGDGGGAGDRFGNGQNTDTLLGGIVRIDVESGESELWQYGLRNPWRFWIDGEDLWIADVGQGSFEEINLAPITTQGLNYGWSITEGAHCFRSESCDTAGLTMPLVEIPRGDDGSCSITGGLVYRGSAIPELSGRFLFSDYCGGYLRSVDSGGEVVDHTGDVGHAGRVVSFGSDGAGEVYVLTTEEILPLVARR